MFSNDNNVESLAQLVEELKKYATLKAEHIRFDVVEKVVRLLTAIAVTLVTAVLLAFILTFLSFTIAYTLAPVIGLIYSFAAVTAFYVLLLILLIINRRRWIERPLLHFFASLLLK